MLSQGWTPGASLGVCNAPYINSPASISHVKVAVKDDNLGLGARNGARSDDRPTTGLDGLQDLLGRLNGKNSQLLQAEQRSRADVKGVFYAERRWGLENFVRGGFLIGDRIQELEERSLETPGSVNNPTVSSPPVKNDEDVSKTGKEKKKRARGSRTPHSLDAAVSPQQSPEKSPTDMAAVVDQPDEVAPTMIGDQNTVEAQRQLLKLERKVQRRARKAERHAAKALKEISRRPAATSTTPTVDAGKPPLAITSPVPESARAYGRHAARQRSVRHKKMSLTDQKALNEVCGLATPLFPMLSMLTKTADFDGTCIIYNSSGNCFT